MSEERKLTKLEKLQLEYETTMNQINGLFLKLTIWQLETGVNLEEEKASVLSLRDIIMDKIKEYKNEA